MGGGDLNMKKSWHPLLLKNQERVWLEEQKALEEKKKLDQLRKEKEEERQLQELQRLQEEQTGKKRTEKLEWMYTTPATGSSQNPNDLEDYLLGKKRVDKILIADENAKVGAAHKNFIAVQNANTIRDVASKIREDPLLSIKLQEQAAYQALLSNPLRLREMQERNGVVPKKEKKPKEDKHAKKAEKKERKRREKERARRSLSPVDRRRSPSYDRGRRSGRSASHERRRTHWRPSRSPSRSPSPYNRRHSHSDMPPRGRSQSRSRSDSRRYPNRSRNRDDTRRRDEDRVPIWPGSDESEDSNHRRNLDHEEARKRRRENGPAPQSPKRSRHRSPSPPRRSDPTSDGASRAARLAAMAANAGELTVDRQKRLQAMLEAEVAEAEREKKARQRVGEMGGFLSQEAKKVYGGIALDEQVKRSRGRMVVDAD